MISATDKLKCVERELAYRKRVYVRLIERGKMTPDKAEREIALMEAILEDYKKLASAELLI